MANSSSSGLDDFWPYERKRVKIFKMSCGCVAKVWGAGLVMLPCKLHGLAEELLELCQCAFELLRTNSTDTEKIEELTEKLQKYERMIEEKQ